MTTRPISSSGVDATAPEGALDLLRGMIEIRRFEEEIQLLFNRNLVRGSTHLCIGQEAVAVGACAPLRATDAMLCTYRGHGAVLAKGAPLDRAFGEILGKAEGLCGGKGGSMHLTDVNVGAYGSFAIVGAHLPIATGFGLAAKQTGADDVSLCFFGDGSVNIGTFHEAMNLASVWKLPTIFVCENNLYGEYSPVLRTTPFEDLVRRADAYDMPGVRVDGNDVRAVRDVVGEAVDRARAGDGPTFVEALTYRHKGHSRTDPGTYRPQEEVEAWLARDPIPAFERVLADEGMPAERIEATRETAFATVAEHLERALAWPDPPAEARFEHVWAL